MIVCHGDELNATTVILACLFWELVWGAPGLFLAMPLMAAIKAICQHVPDWEAWANLMGTREDVPAKHLDSDMLADTQVISPAEAEEHLAAREAMYKGQ